jgi:hypothetical protein
MKSSYSASTMPVSAQSLVVTGQVLTGSLVPCAVAEKASSRLHRTTEPSEVATKIMITAMCFATGRSCS